MSHKSWCLNTAACHGCKFREGHPQRSHPRILTVCNADAVGEWLNSTDTLKTSTGSHGLLHNRVQRDFMKRTLGEFLHCLIDILILTDSVINHPLFCDFLTRTIWIQLVSCLCVQPGHGSTQAQTFRCHHADVRWWESLAQNAAVIYIHRLVCQLIQPFITFIEDWNRDFMTDSLTFFRICIDHNFTLVNNCVKLILHLAVKYFSNMSDTEPCRKCIFADTDPLHISLASVVHTFNTVDIIMKFTLDNWLKIRLHIFPGNFHHIGNTVLAS